MASDGFHTRIVEVATQLGLFLMVIAQSMSIVIKIIGVRDQGYGFSRGQANAHNLRTYDNQEVALKSSILNYINDTNSN